ncbi:MAG: SpoIID/LytB domain-containing protein [Oscillospiraceae bacterium]|jgi:stage II sporulation protein D|nr:SpoIID/LytB domain-containing protein [Oscillospiraceae bacterium]
MRVRNRRLKPQWLKSFTLKITAILISVCLIIPLIFVESTSAFTPSRNVLRIGIRYDATAVTSLTLVSASGFDVGYYEGFNFVVEGSTEEILITVSIGSGTAGINVSNVPDYTGRTNTSTRLFGVRPRVDEEIDTIETIETTIGAERYFGGFRFDRRDGGSSMTVVNIVDVEDYVQGVIPYEMSNGWPIEALKAQAICARTYAMRNLDKHRTGGFDLCPEMHCQMYRGRRLANERTDQAVNETAGWYVTHSGVLADTVYMSSSGGATENSENVWSAAMPYMRGVMDPYEADVASRIPNYNWSRSITQSAITTRVRNSHPNASTILAIWVSQYSPTGNVISVTAKDSNGVDYTYSRRAGLQSLLGSDAIRSQRFNIGTTVWQQGAGIFANSPAAAITPAPQYSVIDSSGEIITVPAAGMRAIDGSGQHRTVPIATEGTIAGTPTGPVNGVFTINGTGWGHNVGMSQWGAYSQAQFHNRTAEQIISFYFTGVTIVKT